MSPDESTEPPRLRHDRVAWWALLAGVYLRVMPMMIWQYGACVRDECGYILLAKSLLAGEGLVPTGSGWLWAPGYPALLAAHSWAFTTPFAAKGLQVVASFVGMILAYHLAGQVGGRRGARVSIWLSALSPTLAFFTTMLWSEAIYTPLLLGALAALGWARRGGGARALAPGALVGLCVLFRGVATYMLPIFAMGLLWERWREKRAWTGALALGLGAALVVGPYSLHATERWGGTVISDRTLGQMMWLGNNDFAPMTFDYGNGALSTRQYATAAAMGRRHCEFNGDPVAWDACEVKAGVDWIRRNPTVFLQRVPVRLAQILNPNSFLTRHLRWGKWRGIPEWGVEGLCTLTVIWSGVAVLLGTLGLYARGRGWLALVTAGVIGYHLAAIALLAGLSRYRVPLDALWLVWSAALIGNVQADLRALWRTPWRMVGCLLTLAVLAPLMFRYLSEGFK